MDTSIQTVKVVDMEMVSIRSKNVSKVHVGEYLPQHHLRVLDDLVQFKPSQQLCQYCHLSASHRKPSACSQIRLSRAPCILYFPGIIKAIN